MLRKYLEKSLLFSNLKFFYSLKQNSKGFTVMLRPSVEKIKNIKKQLKIVIKKIIHQSRKEIYKSFQQINFVLLG